MRAMGIVTEFLQKLIEKQVEAGQLTLEDPDQLGEQKGARLLFLIFHTTHEKNWANWRPRCS